MKNIKTKHISVQATPGAHIREAMREAIVEAMTRDEAVHLTHNGVTHEIVPSEVMNWLEDMTDRKASNAEAERLEI